MKERMPNLSQRKKIISLLTKLKLECGSQKKLADKLGVTQPQVSKWLKGLAIPSFTTAIFIEKAFKGKIKSKDICPHYFD